LGAVWECAKESVGADVDGVEGHPGVVTPY